MFDKLGHFSTKLLFSNILTDKTIEIAPVGIIIAN